MVATRFSTDESVANIETLAWSLAGSLLFTGAVVAFVCGPPLQPLHSWGQLFSLAVLYLMVAACVHALAVWAICQARRDESDVADRPLIWKIIWGAWIAVVWLPLLALLTSEHSGWVALVLPVTAIFAMLLLKWQSREQETDEDVSHNSPALFQVEDSPILRLLLPAVFSSIAIQGGVGLLVADHSWLAGSCFAAGTIYPFERLWNGRGWSGKQADGRSSHRASMGNTVVALLLTAVALVPFLRTTFAANLIGELLGSRHAAAARGVKGAAEAHKSRGYDGVILLMPPRPHPIVAPLPVNDKVAFGKPHEIEFDGVYWYFKQPDTGPNRDARIAHGNPTQAHIHSTDNDSLMMEAHQQLATSIAMSCCRSLKLRVKNADTVPGTIAVEMLLRETASNRSSQMSLGTVVLPSSTVSPMPMRRAPVDETITFQVPRAARGKSFNEITVRIQPERSRSLSGAQVSIQSFVLQP